MRARGSRSSSRPSCSRLPDGHRVRGRRGLEADGEEDDLAVRVLLRELHRVERRVDHPHVAAPRLDAEQVGRRAGHAQHVAERREDDVRAARAIASARSISSSGVTHTGQPGPCTSVIDSREHAVDAGPDERVRLPAADLHERPGARDRARGSRATNARASSSSRYSSTNFIGVRPRRAAGRRARRARPSPRASGRPRRLLLVELADREADVHEHVVARPRPRARRRGRPPS